MKGTRGGPVSGALGLNPLTVLLRAIKAVPAMRYALAVLGLLAVLAIASAWRLDYRVAVFGMLILVGMMVILVFFATVATRRRGTAKRDFLYYTSTGVVCAFGLLISSAAVFLLTASAFRWPRPFYELVFSPPPKLIADGVGVSERTRVWMGPVRSSEMVRQSAAKTGRDSILQQLLESLESDLSEKVKSLDRFQVIFCPTPPVFAASGEMDHTTIEAASKLKAQYVAQVTIVDFAKESPPVKFEAIGVEREAKPARASCVLQLYDATTGRPMVNHSLGPELGVSTEGASLADLPAHLTTALLRRLQETAPVN